MDALIAISYKEKIIRDAFVNGLAPSKLILDRSGDKLFNDAFGVFPEAGVSFYNFIRRDDIEYYETEYGE